MLSTTRMSISPRPRWSRALAVLAVGCLAVSACGSGTGQSAGQVAIGEDDGPQYGDTLDEWTGASVEGSETLFEPQPVNDYPEGYEQITWEDLVPPGSTGDEIYARYADQLADLQDGSPEADAIYAKMQAEYESADIVNDELDGAKVNLAGFVAPLNYEDDVVTEFLLVPYFGACIHVPAPPANQTVLVSVDKADGLTIDQSWGAVWVAGTLTANSATTELATASYTMTDATSGTYDEYG